MNRKAKEVHSALGLHDWLNIPSGLIDNLNTWRICKICRQLEWLSRSSEGSYWVDAAHSHDKANDILHIYNLGWDSCYAEIKRNPGSRRNLRS